MSFGRLGAGFGGMGTNGRGDVSLVAMRATNAGFAPVPELSPSSGLAQTTRAVTAPFNEPFREFEVIYQVFRVRTASYTASIDNGSGAAGDIMTVTAISQGGVYPGMLVGGTGVTAGTYVRSQLTGTDGGIGTYKLSVVQAGVVSSSTLTSSSQLVEELYQGAGAQVTYEAGFEDAVTEAMTGIPNRTRITFDGGETSKVYTYSTWDKTIGHFVSDRMNRGRLSADPLAIWTRATLPSNGSGLPANKLASSNFTNRWWGNDLQGASASADPITASSISAVTAVAGSTTNCIVPVAIRIYTAGRAKTVIVLGDSRSASTGLGGNEPAGYGDVMGDVYGRASEIERGIHGVALQHSLMIAKPTDRAFWLARSPNSWRYRRQIATVCGADTAKVIVNALGQNDQSDAPTTWSSGMDLYAGQAITTSNRVYVVTVAGASGASAPTSTTLGADIGLGTATIRYYGTDATGTNRTGLAIAGKNYLINAAFRAAMPSASIVQEGLGPFTSTTDNWATAANQSDGFNSAAGKTFQAQLAALGASWTGADRYVSSMSLMAGSRTVNGGADDGSRSWKTDGTTAYLMTPDGIHRGNYGAEVGKEAWTRLAVTGAA